MIFVGIVSFVLAGLLICNLAFSFKQLKALQIALEIVFAIGYLAIGVLSFIFDYELIFTAILLGITAILIAYMIFDKKNNNKKNSTK